MKKFYFLILALVLQGILTVDGVDFVDDKNPFDMILKINQEHNERFANKIKDPELFEGDIVMTHELNRTVENMKYAAKTGSTPFDAITGGQWPNGVVPYAFARGFSYAGRNKVAEAIRHYKARVPCVTWRPKRSSDRYYATFYHGGGCSSYIGRQRKPQMISLAHNCIRSLGVVVHEMMHCLGFYHEQSRLDRDRYIRISWGNIQPRTRFNFQKYRAGEASTLGFAYDKRSVMHYGNYAFTTNRRKTIISKANPNEVLGQRRGLSAIDTKQLNKYYNCGGTTRPRPRPSGCKDGYPFCVLFSPSSSHKWCAHSWASRNCKKSCRKCSKRPPTRKVCRDKNKNCLSWKISKYCHHSSYKEFMKINCQKSCPSYCT